MFHLLNFDYSLRGIKNLLNAHNQGCKPLANTKHHKRGAKLILIVEAQ